jgi:putative heme-binding domain-containing protein
VEFDMDARRVLFRIAILTLLATVQMPGRSQGLLQNQLAGLVERTVSGVRFWVPPDFAIERVTPADRTDSYVALTFDARGRLAVSKENDFPRLLLDRDGDGTFEAESILSEDVSNCQGLWFDGPALYGTCAMADPAAPRAPGSQTAPAAGIFRMVDANGDDRADSFETLTMAGRMQEHGPHAIRRTAAGSWMVMMGNNETVADQNLDFSSPVLLNPAGQFLPPLGTGGSRRQGAHSALFEWDATQRRFRVFSGGNRNTYDFAYNIAGEAFLFDSDHEPDIGLPWYRQVRTAHQIPNGDYGYRDTTGKYPAYYLDSLPPLREVGRGSPVGVETYQSYAYPRAYFDNLLEADWSRGRIMYTPLTPAGATYTARPDPTELVHGEPLNVTDLEVGPDGMLYFSTGGRLTQGAVWRLRYTGAQPPQPDRTGILAVVRQEQPLSSWGWAAIERVKGTMGATAFGAALERLARDAGADMMDRARAVYELQRHGPAPSDRLLAGLASDAGPAVRAAVMFAVGYQRGTTASRTAAAGLKDADPLVRRRAAEALVRLGQSPDRPSLAPVGDIYGLLADSDRFVRWAGRILLEHTPRVDWQARVLTDANPTSAPEAMVAWARTAKGPVGLEPLIDRQLTLMQQAKWSADDTLRLYRAFMLTSTLMPGTAGLSAADRERLHAAVSSQFPSANESMNRELVLLIAYAGQPGAIGQILAAMPAGRTNQELTFQYLYALRVIPTGWTSAQKEQLAEVLGRTSKWRGGLSYAAALGQIFDAFGGLYTTDAERALLYAAAPDFAPFTAEEQAGIPARGAGPGGGGGRGGGGRRGTSPIQVRAQNRQIDKGEVFDEVIYTPRTDQADVDAGRAIFEASCAACHRAGGLGTDHGMAALDLTTSARTVNRRALLESIMFPSRQIAGDLRDTIVTRDSGDQVRGLVVRETAQALTILRSDGTTTEVTKPVTSQTRESSTIMLDALTDRMTQPQLTNLLAFLQQ